ncbi:MAG: DASS family sodium-coupled anion symporter [Nitrospirae bacterium]|nr:DASS family sodium-coupled anion symporter [Nitrospirota bacterium]
MDQQNVTEATGILAEKAGFFPKITENIKATGKSPTRTLMGFFGAWAAFFLILYLMPLPTGMTPAAKATLAVVVWAGIMWVTEAIPVGVAGLSIPMLLILSGSLAKIKEAFDGFTTHVAFLCLAAFIFAAVMQAATLDRRIALTILAKIRATSVGGIIWGMFATNVALAFVIPAAVARAATLLPIVNGITRLFGETPQEREAKKAIVIQALVYSAMISGVAIMTAHMPNLIMVGLFEKELKLSVSYIDWFLLQWPYLGMFVLTQWWVRYYFRTKAVAVPGGITRIREMRQEMGKTTQSEWLILMVFAIVGILWVFEEVHKIKTGIIALVGLVLLFTPGLFGFKWKDVQDRTIWGTWFLLGGALSLSFAMGSTGLAKYLANLAKPLAMGQPWWLIILILMTMTHFIRLGMLSNVAAIAMLAPVMLSMAPHFGLHPVAFTLLVCDTDTYAYILPTQITAAVVAYSTGTFSTGDYARVGIVAVLIAMTYGILVMAPWYAFLGLPVWDPTAPWPFGTVNPR